MKNPAGFLIVPLLALLLTGCFTDSATRLALDIESATARMAGHERFRIEHRPAKSRECRGRYTVQLDKVGALIVWCFDSSGKVVASGSTSYHSRFIDAPQTWIVDKPAGSTLIIDVERRAGRPVVVDVR
ncbi:MAG: hypothetical protein MUE59_00475 [Thiobacillaceae bacterium]|jgi:hypothetical protein|nr:hypothetical protein [Thiobacillaceae bacterium]